MLPTAGLMGTWQAAPVAPPCLVSHRRKDDLICAGVLWLATHWTGIATGRTALEPLADVTTELVLLDLGRPYSKPY